MSLNSFAQTLRRSCLSNGLQVRSTRVRRFQRDPQNACLRFRALYNCCSVDLDRSNTLIPLYSSGTILFATCTVDENTPLQTNKLIPFKTPNFHNQHFRTRNVQSMFFPEGRVLDHGGGGGGGICLGGGATI